MRKIDDFWLNPPAQCRLGHIWLKITDFFNGFKAPPDGLSTIDAGSVITDCPANLTRSLV
jgi:hypothetical protein